MGYHKDKMIEDDDRGASFVRELIDGGMLENPALGIAKLWLDQGDEALSDQQHHVLQKYAFGPYITEHCRRCSNSIPWSEMMAAYDNGGFCGRCQHQREKALDE